MRYGPAYQRAVELQRQIMEQVKTSSGRDLARLANSFVRLEWLKIRIREAKRKGISFTVPTVPAE